MKCEVLERKFSRMCHQKRNWERRAPQSNLEEFGIPVTFNFSKPPLEIARWW